MMNMKSLKQKEKKSMKEGGSKTTSKNSVRGGSQTSQGIGGVRSEAPNAVNQAYTAKSMRRMASAHVPHP